MTAPVNEIDDDDDTTDAEDVEFSRHIFRGFLPLVLHGRAMQVAPDFALPALILAMESMVWIVGDTETFDTSICPNCAAAIGGLFSDQPADFVPDYTAVAEEAFEKALDQCTTHLDAMAAGPLRSLLSARVNNLRDEYEGYLEDVYGDAPDIDAEAMEATAINVPALTEAPAWTKRSAIDAALGSTG